MQQRALLGPKPAVAVASASGGDGGTGSPARLACALYIWVNNEVRSSSVAVANSPLSLPTPHGDGKRPNGVFPTLSSFYCSNT